MVKLYKVFIPLPDASLNYSQIKHKDPFIPVPKATQSDLPRFQFSLHRFPQVMHCFRQHAFLSSEPMFNTYLVKTSHRLISTPNLHLKECCFFSIASLLRTLHLCFLCIVPSSRSAKDIFSLLPREMLALVVLLLQYVLVGTGLAFEAVYSFMGVPFPR
jgi:hypothetical protein